MKKVLLVMAALLCIGSVAFAQQDGFKATGMVFSSLAYDVDNEAWGGSEMTVDDETYSFLYYTRFGMTWNRGNLGMEMSFNVVEGYDVGDRSKESNPFLYAAWGSSKWFDNILMVKVGMVRDTTYNSGGKINTRGGEGSGVMVRIRPFEKLDNKKYGTLDFGGGVYVPAGGGPLEIVKLSGGFNYQLDKVFKWVASYSVEDKEFARFTTGLHLLAVDNLRLSLETVMRPIILGDEHPMIIFDEVISYRMDKWTFGIDMYQFLNNGQIYARKGILAPFNNTMIQPNEVARLGLSFDPNVSYRINQTLTAKLGFTGESYGYKSYNAMGKEKVDEIMAFSVRPSFQIRMGMAGQIEMGYKYQAYKVTTELDGVEYGSAVKGHSNKIDMVCIMYF